MRIFKCNKYNKKSYRGLYILALYPRTMSTQSGTTPKTPSEKMKKRLEKKIRMKEERFRKTGDKNYIVERDMAQDELNELHRSKLFSEKNKKLKEKKKNKMKTSKLATWSRIILPRNVRNGRFDISLQKGNRRRI